MTKEGELKKRSITVHYIWKTFSHCLPAKVAKDRLVPMEAIDEAKKELDAIWKKYSEPLDWLHHIGQIKLELEAWKKKWFGDSS